MDSLSEQFGRIYDQYISQIYRFVYLKVGSKDIAEDIVSKVFLSGWESYSKKSKSGQSIDNPKAFLYQIARNSVVDYYRQKGRTDISSTEDNADIADTSKNPYEKVLASADIELVRNSIYRLKKEHQDIIIWYYLDDMSIDEISGILEKPAGTVRVMLHRGLKNLKDIMQES